MNSTSLNKDVASKIAKEYISYTEQKVEENKRRLETLKEQGRIDIIRFNLDIDKIVTNAVYEALEIYDKSPNKNNTDDKLARFLNWRKMRESGKIEDIHLQKKKGLILFYYSKPISAHLTFPLDFEPGSYISIADYLLYKKIALLSIFSGKRVIIADEAVHFMKEWNYNIPRYPVQNFIINKEIESILKKYEVSFKEVSEVSYCYESGINWVDHNDNIYEKRNNLILNIMPDEGFWRIVKRVERFVDQDGLQELVAKYIYASQQVFMSEYRRIPDEFLHITITGKKDGKYELKTVGNINPNYGVSVIKNYNEDKKILIVPLFQLLQDLEKTKQKISLVLLNNQISLVFLGETNITQEMIEEIIKINLFERKI